MIYILGNQVYICQNQKIYFINSQQEKLTWFFDLLSIYLTCNHLIYKCMKRLRSIVEKALINIKKKCLKEHFSCIFYHGTTFSWLPWSEVASATHWLYNLEQLDPSIPFCLRFRHLEFSWMQFTRKWIITLFLSLADT